MHSVAEVERRLAEWKARQPKTTKRPTRRRGHRHTAKTRERISESMRERRKREALAQPGEMRPLRRARLEFHGGVTQQALADLALVSVDVVKDIEAGRRKNISRLTASRLARVLKATPAELGLD